MTKIILKSEDKKEATFLLKDAIGNEKKIVESGIKRTKEILENFEKRYKISSKDFYLRYQNGKMSDNPNMIEWAGECKILQKLLKDYEELKEIKICS